MWFGFRLPDTSSRVIASRALVLWGNRTRYGTVNKTVSYTSHLYKLSLVLFHVNYSMIKLT